MDFDTLSDDYFQDNSEVETDHTELIKKLEDGAHLETIRTSATWKIFREVWERIYQDAEAQLDNVPANQPAKIIELQLTKRFYKNVLATTIRKVKTDAVAAFQQAKERNMLPSLQADLKKDI